MVLEGKAYGESKKNRNSKKKLISGLKKHSSGLFQLSSAHCLYRFLDGKKTSRF
jgi:hypothetical protein